MSINELPSELVGLIVDHVQKDLKTIHTIKCVSSLFCEHTTSPQPSTLDKLWIIMSDYMSKSQQYNIKIVFRDKKGRTRCHITFGPKGAFYGIDDSTRMMTLTFEKSTTLFKSFLERELRFISGATIFCDPNTPRMFCLQRRLQSVFMDDHVFVYDIM